MSTLRTRVGCGANNQVGGGVYKITFLTYLKNYWDNFLLGHENRDHGAHLRAFELKTDWLEKY